MEYTWAADMKSLEKDAMDWKYKWTVEINKGKKKKP
jgi:hypothetical protein